MRDLPCHFKMISMPKSSVNAKRERESIRSVPVENGFRKRSRNGTLVPMRGIVEGSGIVPARALPFVFRQRRIGDKSHSGKH